MILTAFCVALSTLAIGALSYSRIRSETLQLAEVKLAAEARLLSQRFSLAYHQIANDLMTVAETSPVQRLIRSLQNGGIESLDGSSEALWRGRMATIFRRFSEAVRNTSSSGTSASGRVAANLCGSTGHLRVLRSSPGRTCRRSIRSHISSR
ncbi:hypothetical protein WNZ15_14860 [Roseibium sp. AS2]|uniref:hypothetical protein n=1 Tax=Roseibium sp. AS2 TaxID=3135781 RepID=UPI003175497B